MRCNKEHLKQRRQLSKSLVKPERDETDGSWWTAVLTHSSWALWHFHLLIYSISNDAENYFIRVPMLNACLLKSTTVLNYSPHGNVEVSGNKEMCKLNTWQTIAWQFSTFLISLILTSLLILCIYHLSFFIKEIVWNFWQRASVTSEPVG